MTPKWGILLVFLAACWFLPAICSSQNSAVSALQQEQMSRVKTLMLSFKNDSANLLLTQLIAELEEQNSLSSSFGIEVSYLQADVLEKDHQDELAIEKLLVLVELSEQKEEWGVLANAHLSLGRLFEKIGQEEKCRRHLDQAINTIDQYKLAELYTRYAIRNSSYHRLYDNRDSAIFYAREVLRTAPLYNLKEDEAVGHMLLGLLNDANNLDIIVNHFATAGKIFYQVEDISGYSYMHSNLARVYYEAKQYQRALKHNDTTIVAAQQSIKRGHEQNHGLAQALIRRGNIYRALGQQDSAWHYINEGHEKQLSELANANTEKVIEIEESYQNEKKAKQIEEQEQELLQEKQSRLRAWGIILLILIFSAILMYYYIRLRKANRKTLVQAKVINNANQELSLSLEQQIMLQGEVHHRVKNNLQVIISLLELQKEDIRDPKALKSLDTMANRIYSMAAIHEILYQKQGSELVNLVDYANRLCHHFSNLSEEKNKPLFKIDIDNRFFNLETLMPLGIILNELLTNSMKYAQGLKGQLVIGIRLAPWKDGFCISYRDNGPGFPAGELIARTGGLGTYLLQSMSRQLNGHLETINDGGAVSKIYFKEKNKRR